MTTSFEVGSVFQIVDRATPTIIKLAKAVSDLGKVSKDTKLQLQSLGAVKFTGLNASLKMATDRVVALQAAVDKANNGIVGSTNTAAASVQNLANEWRNAAAAARATATAARSASVPLINPNSVAGGGGRGRNPRNMLGGRISGPRLPLPGGGHFGVHGGNAAMLAACALGYGIYQEAELDDAAYRALFTAGVPQDRNVQQARMKQFRDIISAASSKTGASIKDLSEAGLTEVRQFAGFSWDQRMAALPQILAYGAAEGKLKGSSVEEGTDAIIGYAHMLKTYDPESIAGLADKFGFLSTMNPSGITQMLRSSGYAVPILQNLGFDPFQVMMLQSVMTRAGILNTKSGTWLRELGVRSLPGTSMMSRMAFGKHESALKRLGLLDGKDQPTWFTDGAPDMSKLLEIASKRAAAIPLSERAGIEKQLFGSQGSGAFSVLADPRILQMLPQLKQEMDNFKSGNQFFSDYANNSPVQQFMQTWADLRNVLMDIGNVALPPIIGSLQLLDSWLKAIHDHTPSFLIPKKDSLGEALGKGMGAGAIGGALIGGAGGFVVGGPAGAAAGALGGARVGAFAGGLWEGIQHFFAGSDSPVKKGAQDGTEKGARDGVIAGFHQMMFEGGGLGAGGSGGASLIPAMYTSSSYSLGGSSSTGGGTSRGFGGSSSGIGPMGKVSSGGAPLINNSVAGGPLRGNAARLMHDLIAKGWSPEAAAVMAGNVKNESNFNTREIGDHGTSFGLAQWHLDRARRLKAEAGKAGVSWDNWDLQVALMDREWRERYGDAVEGHDFGKLAGLGKRYEGYSTNTFGARVAAAQHYLKQYQSGADQISVVPPPSSEKETHVHNHITLDGRTVAKNTMKHITKMGNGPATGARLPDYTTTRPLSI